MNSDDVETDSDFEEERSALEAFVCTSFSNRLSIIKDREGSTEEFLVRSDHIPIRSVSTNEMFQELYLKMDNDFDGCVIELKSIDGILLPADHLHLMPNEQGSVRRVCSMLKKHVDLCRYTRNQLRQFGFALGIQILYSHGWEVWVGLIPDPLQITPDYSEDVMRKCTYKVFANLRELFGRELKLHAGMGLVRNSLMKTALTKLTRVRLLPDERQTLFTLFQKALSRMDSIDGYKSILFAFRFGERASTPFDYKYFPFEIIRNVSIHIGCTVAGLNGFQILWSRVGLQSVTGTRGTMLPCLSFFEACNWQSNLDGRPLDVTTSLTSLCAQGTLRFIQFYGDTPHRHYEGRHYPISGSIISAGLFPPAMTRAFNNDSECVISTVTDNCDLLRDLRCRVEIVACFNTVPDSL